MAHLLAVENLRTLFNVQTGVVNAVNGLSYYLDENEIVGLVGESGCGKTASQLSVLQLVSPPGRIAGGRVLFEGRDLLEYSANSKEMCAIRGGKIAMVFQEPASSLNPVLSIGCQITEMLEKHLGFDANRARERAIELLNLVKIPDARRRFKDCPYQFSGGMLQRVMIAMSLSCAPRVLIADEPTSALDVTNQIRILKLMKELVGKYKTSMLLVTHNLGILPGYAQRVYVMYGGQIVESGTIKDVFDDPRHPYTRRLIKCFSRPDNRHEPYLDAINGFPPDLVNLPVNCSFLSRCDCSVNACFEKPVPAMSPVKAQHYVRCHGAA